MTDLDGNGNHPKVLDADVCDDLIRHFRGRLETLQRDAAEVRREFERLHARWLEHIENRDGGSE